MPGSFGINIYFQNHQEIINRSSNPSTPKEVYQTTTILLQQRHIFRVRLRKVSTWAMTPWPSLLRICLHLGVSQKWKNQSLSHGWNRKEISDGNRKTPTKTYPWAMSLLPAKIFEINWFMMDGSSSPAYSWTWLQINPSQIRYSPNFIVWFPKNKQDPWSKTVSLARKDSLSHCQFWMPFIV